MRGLHGIGFVVLAFTFTSIIDAGTTPDVSSRSTHPSTKSVKPHATAVVAPVRGPKILGWGKGSHPLTQFGKLHVVKKPGWGWDTYAPGGWDTSGGWSSSKKKTLKEKLIEKIPKKSFGVQWKGGVGFSFGGKKGWDTKGHGHGHAPSGWGWGTYGDGGGWGWGNSGYAQNHGWGQQGGWGWGRGWGHHHKPVEVHHHHHGEDGWGWDGDYDDEDDDEEEDDAPADEDDDDDDYEEEKRVKRRRKNKNKKAKDDDEEHEAELRELEDDEVVDVHIEGDDDDEDTKGLVKSIDALEEHERQMVEEGQARTVLSDYEEPYQEYGYQPIIPQFYSDISYDDES